MFGNGAQIGTARTITATAPQQILRDQLQACTVSNAVAAGTTLPGAAAPPFGSAARLRAATSTLACALPVSSSKCDLKNQKGKRIPRTGIEKRFSCPLCFADSNQKQLHSAEDGVKSGAQPFI